MIKIGGEEVIVIDAHTHIWDHFGGQRFGNCPIEVLPYGKAKLKGKVFQQISPEYSDDSVKIEVLLGYMDYVHVDKAVILQNPCYGGSREYIHEILDKYPDKFVGIGMLDPRNKENIKKEIDILVNEYKFKGVKMEIPDTPFIMDDAEYDFLWKKIVEKDCIVVIDMGWGKGLYDYDNNIDKLKNVLKKYSNIKMVLTHLGVSRLWDLEQKYPFPKLQETFKLIDINKENLWFDCSAIDEFDNGEYPYYRGQEILKAIKERWGMDRIMWGTDFPTHLLISTYKQFLDFIIKHCDFLTENELKMILCTNALKVYFR